MGGEEIIVRLEGGYRKGTSPSKTRQWGWESDRKGDRAELVLNSWSMQLFESADHTGQVQSAT